MPTNEDKKTCCGCEVCSALCPASAITMVENEEGYLYPSTDRNRCIKCGVCTEKCAFKISLCAPDSYTARYRKVFAVKHKDITIRMKSRSGGIFTAVSDYVLQQGGVVYGAILSENTLMVKHEKAEDKKSRDYMCGSKYVQSKTDAELYKDVKAELERGRLVLFSGTSCQVAALKAFVGKRRKNLICMDIVCHGVPSPKLYQDYLLYQTKKLKSSIASIDFRNKKSYGWAGHVETLRTTDGRKKDSCLWTDLFYQHNLLRPSCYVCPYKSLEHPGDITIADYWGIDRALPGFSDNKGVSLVLVNTEIGEKLFFIIKDVIELVETDISLSMQLPLEKPFPEPQEREKFWNDYRLFGFDYIVKKYASKSWMLLIKYRIKKILMDMKLYKVTK